jgi:hypothetical protein
LNAGAGVGRLGWPSASLGGCDALLVYIVIGVAVDLSGQVGQEVERKTTFDTQNTPNTDMGSRNFDFVADGVLRSYLLDALSVL